MKNAKKIFSVLMLICMFVKIMPTATVSAAETYSDDVHRIVLSTVENEDGSYIHSATYDGELVKEYDYTWHADPSTVHSDVKNSPAEYYTGTEPDSNDAVYIAHDIYYYPELNPDGFTKVQYDDDTEWAYYYTAEGYTEYIFATLPVTGNSIPSDMMHSEEEAYQNAVLHITEAGTYIIEGEWYGQIWIDLGDTDDTFTDVSAKVTVILNGVDVTCTVAPALVFYSVYECDNDWENQSSWSKETDTSEAGANVIIADGTVNSFTGENVYRILKTKYKSDDDQSQNSSSVTLQKKRLKIDGAFYSYVSMNVEGESEGTGVLNIISGYEGLDTELHLTINSGNVNIYSQDDGINVNEDNVSVVTINGGEVHILAGLGNEGDGIDSNGYLVINGGTVISMANPSSDSGMDSDCGSFINGGIVVALGSTMDWAESDNSNVSGQAVMNLQFSTSQSAGEAIIITDEQENVVFAYDPDKDEVAGTRIRNYQGAVISSEALLVGNSYHVYIGGDVYGTEHIGIYDISTVTGFSEDAELQCYTGTSVGGMGNMGNMEDVGNIGKPEDMDNMGNMGNMGNIDDSTHDTTIPDKPDDKFTPEQDNNGFGDNQFEPMQPGGESVQNATCAASNVFIMTEKVNAFSGVTDYPDHTFGEWTETENGIKQKTCSVCGYMVTKETGVVIEEDGSIYYYEDGVINTTYTGMATDNITGKKYWFDEGEAARNKEAYDPNTDNWYWFDEDGIMAVNQDVYLVSSDKWVRYDENGAMVKGEDYRYGGWYYFDVITGKMVHGEYVDESGYWYYDEITGIGLNQTWYEINGVMYWYENGKRQGTENRGKEIYDAATDGWYWLDANNNGAMAVSKDVYLEYTDEWVRYDESGKMVKGWDMTENGSYYFDLVTGAMAKGSIIIDNTVYYFDTITGILQ